jgi:alpha-L-rhamnosidase
MKDQLTRRIAACLIAVVAMLACIQVASAANLTHLRCEYRENPLGIDAAKPRLSWQISDLKSEIPRGQKQTAYQVLVASSEELLKKDKGDLWDSGKVASDQSIQAEYGGPLLSKIMPA